MSRPASTTMLIALTTMFAIQKLTVQLLMLMHLVQLSLVLLNLLPYLEEVLEMGLQSGRQEVQRPIRLVPRRHDNVVLHEDPEMVSHGLVIQLQGRRQGVRVVWSGAKQVDDFRAVQAPAGSDDEMPQALVHGTARGLRRPHM